MLCHVTLVYTDNSTYTYRNVHYIDRLPLRDFKTLTLHLKTNTTKAVTYTTSVDIDLTEVKAIQIVQMGEINKRRKTLSKSIGFNPRMNVDIAHVQDILNKRKPAQAASTESTSVPKKTTKKAR